VFLLALITFGCRDGPKTQTGIETFSPVVLSPRDMTVATDRKPRPGLKPSVSTVAFAGRCSRDGPKTQTGIETFWLLYMQQRLFHRRDGPKTQTGIETRVSPAQ